MKTRKYKDDQQRKKFAQNESKIFLIQYFKKKKKVINDCKDFPNESLMYKEKASIVQSFSSNFEAIQNSKSTPASQVAVVSNDYKKWSSFKYPTNLSTFFLERPSLKSTYLLINLKDHVSELGANYVATRSEAAGTIQNTHNQSLDLIKAAIKDLAFKVCYSKKAKQQQNKTRIRGRCIQSNRPRSVSRLLRLSRIRIRTLALEGKIPGCTRSTW